MAHSHSPSLRVGPSRVARYAELGSYDGAGSLAEVGSSCAEGGSYVDAELAMAEIVIEVRELLRTVLDPAADVRGELEEAAADVWVLNLVSRDGAVLSGVFTGHLPPEEAEWLVFLRPAGRGPEATVSRPMRTPEVRDEVRSFVAEARRRREEEAEDL